jgi:hypothetical protein
MPTVNQKVYNTGGNYAISAGRRGPTNTWAGVRGATIATSVGQSNPAIHVSAVSGGRGVSYNLARLWMWFPLGSYAPNITNLELKIESIVSPVTTFTVRAVRGNGFSNNTNTTLTTADFNNLDFSTPYMSSAGTWLNSITTNPFTLNSNAVNDANNNSKLGVCLINDSWDYNNVDPYTGTSFDWGNYVDWANLDTHVLAVTYSAGYGNDVNGVASADIGSINGIATGDISTMNGL